MIEVFLGFGGNLEGSQEAIEKAIEIISKFSFVYEFKKSPLYRTSPISDIEQNDYLNCVSYLKTDLRDPFLFFQEIEKIEKRLGKKPKPKNEPRLIDIDLLLFGEAIIDENELEIPHPRMLERLFVLKPLNDLTSYIYYPTKQGVEKVHLEKFIQIIENESEQQVALLECYQMLK